MHLDVSVKDAKKLFVGLVLFEIFLALIFVGNLALGSPSLNFKAFVDLDGEGNFPAWFSAAQLFLVGFVFLLKSRQSGLERPPSSFFFLTVSAGFVFLSADEAAKIHELIWGVLDQMIFKGGQSYYWILLYALLGLLFVIVSFRSLIAMWVNYRKEAILFMSGMALIVLGAVFLETISFMVLRDNLTGTGYLAEVVCEEFLEMFGASVILYGALLLLLNDSGENAPS